MYIFFSQYVLKACVIDRYNKTYNSYHINLEKRWSMSEVSNFKQKKKRQRNHSPEKKRLEKKMCE